MHTARVSNVEIVLYGERMKDDVADPSTEYAGRESNMNLVYGLAPWVLRWE